MSNINYHYLLQSQLTNMDLSPENPPTPAQWKEFIGAVDGVYAQAQAVSQQKSDIIARLAAKLQAESKHNLENAQLERKLKESMFLNRIISANHFNPRSGQDSSTSMS